MGGTRVRENCISNQIEIHICVITVYVRTLNTSVHNPTPYFLSWITSLTQTFTPPGFSTFKTNLFYAYCENFTAIGEKLRELWPFPRRRCVRNCQFTITSLYIASKIKFAIKSRKLMHLTWNFHRIFISITRFGWHKEIDNFYSFSIVLYSSNTIEQ